MALTNLQINFSIIYCLLLIINLYFISQIIKEFAKTGKKAYLFYALAHLANIIWNLCIYIVLIIRTPFIFSFISWIELSYIATFIMVSGLSLYLFKEFFILTSSIKVIVVLVYIITPFLFSLLILSGKLNLVDSYFPQQLQIIYTPTKNIISLILTLHWVLPLTIIPSQHKNLSGIKKIQLKYLAISLSVTIITIILLNLILPTLINRSTFSPLGPIIVLFYFYSIYIVSFKYRFLDLSKSLPRIIYFGLKLFMLIVVFHSLILSTHFEINLIILCILAFLIDPILKTFQKVVQIVNTKEIGYEYISEFMDKISTELDLHSLLSETTIYLDKIFKASESKICLQEKNSKIRLYPRSTINPKYLITMINRCIYPGKSTKPIDVYELEDQNPSENSQKKKEVTYLKSNQIQLIIPLDIKANIKGYILLGERYTKEIYSSYDLELISRINQSVSVAISRALLYKQKTDLVHSLQEKIDTIDTIGHEIKNPMALLNLNLPRFLKSAKPKAGQKDRFRKYQEQIKYTLKKQNLLLKKLLTTADIDSTQISLDLEPTYPKDILESCFEAYQLEAQNKNLKLVTKNKVMLDKLPQIKVDPIRFQEIIDNLVSNAIKYTSDGKVEISARLVRKNKTKNHKKVKKQEPKVWLVKQSKQVGKKDMIEFIVEDSGLGMSKKDLKQLGTKFFRTTDASSQYTKGTGLGLYIVLKLVKEHKGALWVESTYGKGSRFGVRVGK